MNDVLIDTKFYDIGFINLNGDVVTANNNYYDVKNKKFFYEIISGKKYYFEYEFDEQINEYIFYIAIPTYQDKKITGVIFAKEGASEVVGYCDHQENIGEMDKYILHSDGTIICKNNSSGFNIGENFFNELNDYNKNNKILDIQNKIKNKQRRMYYEQQIYSRPMGKNKNS